MSIRWIQLMTDRRKRAAPTIDLKAAEVPEPSAAKPESSPTLEEVSAPLPEPPYSQEPPKVEPSSTLPPRDFIKTYAIPIAAGFAGAILAGVVIWTIGLLPAGSTDRSEIAALKKQIHDLQNRPVPAADTQTVDALRERVVKIEHDIANLSPGDKTVAERLTAADSAMKSFGVALAALNKRNNDAAADAKDASARVATVEKAVSELRDSVQNAKQQASAAVDTGQLAAVQQRVAVLEQSIKGAHAQLAQIAMTDKTARLALSARALRDVVESGAPYQSELAQAKVLSADDNSLAPLALFAERGVPSQQALAQQLSNLIPALIKAAKVPDAPSGFLKRLQANAGKLVRIQPLDAPVGDAPSDVLARIEVAAAHADIVSALANIDKLPEKARQQAADWVAVAVARQKALAAARSFASDSARALGQP